ncbi:MAG: GNAT family N-acetyltransferase [Flavobacteriia bacterium]|nr:GNAT family N-acetyltransferase [Flavobacteriia bacterium]
MEHKITLRPWRKSDFSTLADLANNPSIAKNLTDKFPQPYTEKDAKDFIKKASIIVPCTRFAIFYNETLAGSIGVYPLEDINRLNAELGYWIGEAFWGKGIITKAIAYMLDYVFEILPIDRVFARPFPHNTASIKALEKNGFVLEATIKEGLVKNNKKMDELIYSINKSKRAIKKI